MKAIFAVGSKGEFGTETGLIDNIKEDLEHFKKETLNKIVIMGQKTWETLPNKLPNRINIVLGKSSEKKGLYPDFVFETEKELLDFLKTQTKEAFIIGGVNTIKRLLHLIDEIIVTIIPEIYPEATVFLALEDFENFKTKTRTRIPVNKDFGFIEIWKAERAD